MKALSKALVLAAVLVVASQAAAGEGTRDKQAEEVARLRAELNQLKQTLRELQVVGRVIINEWHSCERAYERDVTSKNRGTST